jgi:N-acetylmuramoyl-L-alanine amidase
LQTALPQSGNRKAAVIPNANYIMQHLSCPAVILECGFLSNPEEEMLLCTPEYQAKIAFCISTAVLDAVSNGEICPGTVQR